MMIDRFALILAIVGALNWGSIGLFGFDCVAFLLGGQLSTFSRIVYTLVALAAHGVLPCCSVIPITTAILSTRKHPFPQK